MKFEAIVLVIFLVAGTIFYLFNPAVVMEARSIQLPGGVATGPVLGITLLVAAGFMLLMLLADAVVQSLHNRERRRLEERIGLRDQEIVHFKSDAYDEVSQKLEAVRQEITERIDALTQRVEDQTRLVEERSREVAGSSFSH